MRDELEQGVEVADGDVNNTPRPEEEADVGSELTIRPVVAILPREHSFLDGFVDEFHSFGGEIKRQAAPFEGSGDHGLKTLVVDVLSFIDGDVGVLAAAEKDTRVVEDILLVADKNDVVNVGECFAAAFLEIQEEESCCLGNVATLTLTHDEAILTVILITLTKTKIFTNSVAVGELVVVRCKVEGSSVRAVENEVCDFVFLGKFDVDESTFVEDVVDVSRFADRAKSSLEVFRHCEVVDPTFDTPAWDFSDVACRHEFVNEGFADCCVWAAIRGSAEMSKTLFVKFRVEEELLTRDHVVADSRVLVN